MTLAALRRKAARHGMRVSSRDGGVMLIDADRNALIDGAGYSLDIEQASAVNDQLA